MLYELKSSVLHKMVLSRHWTMGAAVALVCIAALTIGLVIGLKPSTDREFTIDHVNNTFLMDGEPFHYISGSFHYFRALPEAWNHRLQTMKAAGLNAIDTYVEWSLHNPHDGVYNWDGIADVEKFIELATAQDFYIILRPGPYICAERDNGGLPHWLFKKYPGIKMRTSDSNYTQEVAKWYAALMPKFQKYLYGNGGNIIMVQVENEYGVFEACDFNYTRWLRDETEKYVGDKALLFTTDIPNERMHCGKIENVFATTDFGIDRIHEIDNIWSMLRKQQPTGPLVNSEFYPGWLTHWQEDNQRRDGKLVAEALQTMLTYNASVNFYMFFGGTNFGFTAGANDWGFGDYMPDITSYDYDAVMDEAGGVTPKFELVRRVIAEYRNITLDPLPPASKRLSYGQVQLTPIVSLLSLEGREALAAGSPVIGENPMTFEELDQYSGLILYETYLPPFEIDPTLLTVKDLRDRAFVFVDGELVGTLSRENRIYSLPLSNGWGHKLQILVENQGRINFNVADDTKGILGTVSIQKLDGEKLPLTNWNSTAFPLDTMNIEKLVEKYTSRNVMPLNSQSSPILRNGPVVYHGEFTVSDLGDTYLNPTGWGKGVAYVNGLNLGRYWPLAGPQLTMYVPNEILKLGINTIVLIEYQRINNDGNNQEPTVSLDAEPKLDI